VSNNHNNASTSTNSIVKELESITSLLDEIQIDYTDLCDGDEKIPILSHIIEDSTTVTSKHDNMMVAQSLFPNDDAIIEQAIPTLTQALVTAKSIIDEEQLILPPVEELDAELAMTQPSVEPTSIVDSQQIEQAVKQCMMELETIVREKISKILTENNN
jgi:hypothetical protein